MEMQVTDIERTDGERLVSVVVPGVMGTTETLIAERWNGHCPCGRHMSAKVWRLVSKTAPAIRARHPKLTRVAAQSFQDEVHVPSMGNVLGKCPDCGVDVPLIAVRGKQNHDVACDVRCTSAHGHNCECSCGGANHGADWA